MKRKKKVSFGSAAPALKGKWQESLYATYNTINGYGIVRQVWCLGFHNNRHFFLKNQAESQRWLLGFYFFNDLQSLVHVNI